MLGNSEWVTILIMAVIATWGGIVRYYRKIQAGMSHQWFLMFGELSASALAGICLGMTAISADMSIYVSMALAGVGGHLGTNFFDIAEETVKRFFDKQVNKE